MGAVPARTWRLFLNGWVRTMDAHVKAQLEGIGVDIDVTMARFLDNEDLYFKYLKQSLEDEDSFVQLSRQLEENDYTTAFDTVHTLKGVFGNLGLTHLYDALSGLTEALRGTQSSGSPAAPVNAAYDVSPVLAARDEAFDALRDDLDLGNGVSS